MAKKDPSTELLSPPVPVPVTPASPLIEEPADVARWLDGYTVEHVVSLQDGQGIAGRFLGAGPRVTTADPDSGEPRELLTWRVEVRPGLVARLVGSARLDAEFGALPEGTEIRVLRLGEARTRRNRRVIEYVVAARR